MKVSVNGQEFSIYGFAADEQSVYIFLSEDGEVVLKLRPDKEVAYFEGNPVPYPYGLLDELWKAPGCGTCRHRENRSCAAGIPAVFMATLLRPFPAQTVYKALGIQRTLPLAGPISFQLCSSYRKKD